MRLRKQHPISPQKNVVLKTTSFVAKIIGHIISNKSPIIFSLKNPTKNQKVSYLLKVSHLTPKKSKRRTPLKGVSILGTTYQKKTAYRLEELPLLYAVFCNRWLSGVSSLLSYRMVLAECLHALFEHGVEFVTHATGASAHAGLERACGVEVDTGDAVGNEFLGEFTARKSGV